MKKIVVLMLCLLLAVCFAACTPAATQSPETSAPSAEESTAEPTPAPEEMPTPAPEEEGAVPTPAPEGEEEESHSVTLPMPESSDQAFVAAFMENPIDQRYSREMELASSLMEITDVNRTAAESWKSQIDAAYVHILEIADADTVEKVKAEQEAWLDVQETRLQEIRDSVDEENAMAAVTVAENIMLYYRSRAIDLCAVVYGMEEQLVFG